MGSQGGDQGGLEFRNLSWRSSLYGLTLDEIQDQFGSLGKPLGSMNLDELLKSVWSAEANQSVGMGAEDAANLGTQQPSGSELRRQGSTTLKRTLSKKTVDEVWREIQLGKVKNNEEKRQQEREETVGEMTLEAFLMKAGVVPEASETKVRVNEDLQNLESNRKVGSRGSFDSMRGGNDFPQQAHWMRYQHQQQPMMNPYMQGSVVTQPLGASANPLLETKYSEKQMALASPLLGTVSDTQTIGRKRGASGDLVEKSIERRQKRMIKNRESAARSRARKQAYTNELENKVSRLEEENERLKKQKELDSVMHSTQLPEPKYQLRRTSSAPF